MVNPVKSTDKLLKRLRDELKLNISPGSTIERTRAGIHQRRMDAMSWFLIYGNDVKLDDIRELGSYETVGELLKAKKLRIYNDDFGLIVEKADD